MKQRVRVAIVLVLVAAAAGFWWFGRGSRNGAAGLSSSGVVEATEADLGFQLPGKIVMIGPREGDRVTSGEELAALDRTELDARLAVAQSQVDAAESQLTELERGSRPEEIAQAEARLRAAREQAADADRDLERAQVLREGGAISQEALDKARTAQELARSNMDAASDALELVRQGPRPETIAAQRARVQQAWAAVAQAQALLDQATIVAPFGGVVTVRHREPGETVAAGAPVLTIRDMEDRWVRIYVREDAIGRVSVGQAADVTSDSYPDRRFEGRVTFIASEAEFTPRNVQTPEERTRLVYAVKVRISGDPDHVLKPGVPADVRLLDGEAAGS